ncbi:hypothetical protein B0H17DRAFT_1186251 [Mycena rosella]|uniref:Uncharacterized protein n=1 Tax=Mycena rosella TaxID=1033263 RepID=A0AAD7CMZ9_MYCRO|nr:hypothetical protein B0H17DRAFT_1186251 [Mycena rosella]
MAEIALVPNSDPLITKDPMTEADKLCTVYRWEPKRQMGLRWVSDEAQIHCSSIYIYSPIQTQTPTDWWSGVEHQLCGGIQCLVQNDQDGNPCGRRTGSTYLQLSVVTGCRAVQTSVASCDGLVENWVATAKAQVGVLDGQEQENAAQKFHMVLKLSKEEVEESKELEEAEVKPSLKVSTLGEVRTLTRANPFYNSTCKYGLFLLGENCKRLETPELLTADNRLPERFSKLAYLGRMIIRCYMDGPSSMVLTEHWGSLT